VHEKHQKCSRGHLLQLQGLDTRGMRRRSRENREGKEDIRREK
jgi:hypothetical protein